MGLWEAMINSVQGRYGTTLVSIKHAINSLDLLNKHDYFCVHDVAYFLAKRHGYDYSSVNIGIISNCLRELEAEGYLIGTLSGAKCLFCQRRHKFFTINIREVENGK